MKQVNLFLVFTNSALAVINFGFGNFAVAMVCVVIAILCGAAAATDQS